VIIYHFTVNGSKKAAEVAIGLVELTGSMVCIRPFEEQKFLLSVWLRDEDELAKVGKFLDRSL